MLDHNPSAPIPSLDHELRQNLSRSQGAAEQTFSLPPKVYRDEAIAHQEIDAIFKKKWFSIGRADRFEANGDFDTLDVLGVSLILLRDNEGKLRAFANSCRHRGARLLDGSGNCRGIRWPFHSWSYRLDGSLAGAPRMSDSVGFDKADHGLVEFSIDEVCGFAFVSLNPDVEPLTDQLGDFAQLHAPWPLGEMKSARRRSFEVGCNWKCFLEVFNEYYHLPFVHADSIDAVYDDPEPGDQVTGQYASQFGKTQGTGGLLEAQQSHALPDIPNLGEAGQSGVRYTWVFPNLAFAAGTDAVWLYEAYPLGPNRCIVYQTTVFHPETMALPQFDEKVEQYHIRMDAALAEDVPALENHHRGLCSPHAQQGRFSPLLEINVATFADWYAGHLMNSN
jgi:phenylpropionate dioxygenase-like ring-hydroxylating dioxygenase large terminal subunit